MTKTILANIGDVVKIMETRPLSKDKRWRLVEVVEKAVMFNPIKTICKPKGGTAP